MEQHTPPSPAQTTTGWRAAFSLAPVYRFAQRAIGADAFRRWLVDDVIRPSADDAVLDMGCGTADILERMPACEYLGFDMSDRYIDSARDRFGDARPRARFVVGTAEELALDDGHYSVAIAVGVLHHLDDAAAASLLSVAARALRPGGRLITIDPTLTPDQHRIARALALRDRGRHVRTPDAASALVPSAFRSVAVSVHHDRLRMPYSHVLIEAER